MMKNRLQDIRIDKNNPFANDKLNRKECADNFIRLIQLYANSGCVIALNGEWGSGKTTFVKMVLPEMKSKKWYPLYFNAWENDFVSDPLVAFLSELKELAPNSDKIESIIKNGCKILTSMVGTLVKSVLKNSLGVGHDVFAAGTEEVVDIFKENIDAYANQKKSLADFKKILTEYIAEYTNEGKPVVFFVDELDRCNPHFAVKVLERIKHLFDVPNIIFVLSICKKQLEYAVQGYYGSSNIDAANYLRRFIDVEFTLPKPTSEKLCSYLYDYYGIGKILHKVQRATSDFMYDDRNFVEMSQLLVRHYDIDIRTLDKIYVHIRLSLCEFDDKSHIYPNVLFLMCFIKVIDTQLYNSIENHAFTIQELLYNLEDFLPDSLLRKGNSYNNSARYMTYIIMLLLHMYDTDSSGIEYENFFTTNKDDKKNFASHIIDHDLMLSAYNSECDNVIKTPLNQLIEKINLYQSLDNNIHV